MILIVLTDSISKDWRVIGDLWIEKLHQGSNLLGRLTSQWWAGRSRIAGCRLGRRIYDYQAKGVKGFEKSRTVKMKRKDFILRDIWEEELTSNKLDKENNREKPNIVFNFQAWMAKENESIINGADQIW